MFAMCQEKAHGSRLVRDERREPRSPSWRGSLTFLPLSEKGVGSEVGVKDERLRLSCGRAW